MRTVRLVKFLKDPFLGLLRDPRTLVLNRHKNHAGTLCHAQNDPTARLAVLDRVVDQVAPNVRKDLLIAEIGHRIQLQVRFQILLLPPRLVVEHRLPDLLVERVKLPSADILLLPQLAFQVCKKLGDHSAQEQAELAPSERIGYKPPEVRTLQNSLITFLLAEGFGFLGKLSGIPAGAMTFAIFAVAAFNIKTSRAYLPKRVKLVAQCIMGTIVGLGVTMEDVRNMPALIEPILIVLLCTLLCNYICGFLMHKICKLDISTSLFGSIPAGVSDMALIATDLGGDAPKVAVLQLVRYIGLFSVMPIVIKYITG